MFLLIAAIQYEELVGYCYKEGNIANIKAPELVTIGFLDSKENCLKQCLLKEGATGCQMIENGNKKFCSVVISVSVVSSSGGVESNICWKFITDEGKSQY